MALLVFPLSLFALGLVFAIVDWIAVVIEHKPLEYVAKPATLLAFIAGAGLVAMATGGGRLALWFLLALAFSLLGDVFLMLPGDRWFPLGLGAFLLAQICYVVGLTPTQPPTASLWLFVPIVALDLLVLPRVICGASRAWRAGIEDPHRCLWPCAEPDPLLGMGYLVPSRVCR